MCPHHSGQTPSHCPSSCSEGRSTVAFLFGINYYGKFIPNAATILHPVNVLLRKEAKWKWSKECLDLAKEKLTSEKMLTHYTPTLSI